MMRLCFGTYAAVLRSSIPKKGKNLVTSQKRFIGIVLMSVNSAYDITSDDYATSRLASCLNSLAADVTEGAQKANFKTVANYFENEVLPLLDPNKTKLVILALRDIIFSDSSIDEDTAIDLISGITKSALHEQSGFKLGEFLAGVFLYTARAVDNTVGKECVKNINGDYISKFESDKDKIKLIDNNFPKIYLHPNISDSANINAKVLVNFRRYLGNAKEKYSQIKTLLYNDQPKPFYDFYVCNDIERRIPVPGQFGTSDKISILNNITVKSLTECSRFVILAGTGGLGKSMMMRHLLLNAVETYENYQIIPVFIPLKDFDESVDSLFEYIFSKVSSLNSKIKEDQLDFVLKNGKCILLFDGLDEIGSANGKRFEREIENFTDKYPENRFIISSRPYQTFISYSRFTVLCLKPFSKIQALKLIDKLEFRPDEPIIKEKFRTELSKNLYLTHSAFIENPLLLTIMLLTFEQYAEVPSKMHVFYREAFAALSIKHDASKGAYKRTLKTSLTVDIFSDYFAELCSRSYYDEKFELTEDEFAKYYNELKEREKYNDWETTASDFLYDLCSNMCLMYFESGKYHFTHRSFQEYFCALYFSKQKDKNLKSIGEFFEKRQSRMNGDKTFNMLYDMIPDKVEEYIFLPFLTELYKQCDNLEGYWTFLEKLYPSLSYERGETNEFILNSSQSYLFDFIRQLNWLFFVDCNDFPHYDSLVRTEYVYVNDKDGSQKLVDVEDLRWEYPEEYVIPDTVGWVYEFNIQNVQLTPMEYIELLICLENDKFSLKEEYVKIREYLETLQAKQRPTGDSLFDLF